MSSIGEAYDYFEVYGDVPPAELIQGGGSSADYLRALKLEPEPPMLVTELPYFQTDQVADQTSTDQTRREVILAGIRQAKDSVSGVKAILERIAPEMTVDSRFYRAVSLFTEQTLDALPSRETWAAEAADMNQPATVAQRTDELYLGSFYRFLVASMLRRALEVQARAFNQRNPTERPSGSGNSAGNLGCAVRDGARVRSQPD